MAVLIKIGNSQGIRIPKPFIKQANLENSEIEFKVIEDGLLLKPIKKRHREHWESNIKEVLAKHGDKNDEALLEDFLNEEFDEWEW